MTRRILGRYELREELGRGGMGLVWAAWDRERRREAAVKLLAPPAHLRDLSSMERRFLREVSITGRLDHPGIPTVYDHGRLDGELYLVMELIPGRTLDEVVADEGRLPAARAARIGRSVADVLAYTHAQDVVHRDLKPSNVMLTPSGGVKVLDFGIAAALEPLPGETRFTAVNAAPGSAPYMSPEQALGKAQPAGDLYSLGCVLYELLAGRPPFMDGNAFMIYRQHMNDDAPPLSSHRRDVPPELEGLVSHLLEKKPELRPASAAEVRDRLARCAPEPAEHAASLPVDPSSHPRLTELGALRRACQPARALAGYEELVADATAPPEAVLEARVGAALCAADLGRTREALTELAAVLAEQRAAYGQTASAVLDTRFELAVLYARAGYRQKAEGLLRLLTEDEDATLPLGDGRRGRSPALLDRLGRMA
ncbi:serine/threonine-protein kinase [Streptomyces sp. TR06-5]|uniref:serine/threonine-protein kinase n=1 Tax=Streptomyces sp. TR06-5 TaxID=3385976 RepID=UPI0039A2E534